MNSVTMEYESKDKKQGQSIICYLTDEQTRVIFDMVWALSDENVLDEQGAECPPCNQCLS